MNAKNIAFELGERNENTDAKVCRWYSDEINLKWALESLNYILKSSYKIIINGIKTEVTICFKDPENIIITMDDDALKQVTKFEYLCSIFTEERKSKEDIMQRVNEAKVMFSNKKQLCSNNLSLEIKKKKKKLIKSYIWSVALFGSETWTLGKNEGRVVNAFETWCWRRILKIKWPDKITNDEVFQRTKEEKLLLKILKTK